MGGNPQCSPQLGKPAAAEYAVLELLGELHDLRCENRKLRRKVAALEAGRARWRTEARNWKWHALGWRQTRYV